MPPSNKLLYRQFRLCITKASGKAHTPKYERAHPKAPLCKGRHFVSSIISQIGRENKFSAEIYVPVISPLRMQREDSP